MSNKEAPWVKWFSSDFLGGTSGLSPSDRGNYVTLLCLMYEAEGPIKADLVKLARRCGLPKAAFVRSLETLIEEGKIYRPTPDTLSNKRAESTIAERKTRVGKASTASVARWEAERQKSLDLQGPENSQASFKDTPEDMPEASDRALATESRSQSPEERESLDEPSRVNARDERGRLTDRERFLSAIGVDYMNPPCTIRGRALGNGEDKATWERWIEAGLTVEEIEDTIREISRKKPDGPPNSFAYFEKGIARLLAAKRTPIPSVAVNGHAHPATPTSNESEAERKERIRRELREDMQRNSNTRPH